MINYTFHIGRITKDLELKYTNSNKSCCNFNLAVAKDKDTTDFFSFVAWNSTAENLCKYCKKGDLIGVVGRLSVEKFTDSQGVEKTINKIVVREVQFLNTKGNDNVNNNTIGTPQNESSIEDEEEDFPF